MANSINANQCFPKSSCLFEYSIAWHNRISRSYKRLWILLIPLIIISFNGYSKELSDNNTTSNKILFSIEEISEEEFLQAERTSAEYNLHPQKVDSIVQKNVLDKVFLDAQERFAKLDSTKRSEIFELVVSLTYFGLPDSVAESHASKIIPEDELYSIDHLIYYPELNLLGFFVPTDFFGNCIMWWYDSTSGLPFYETDFGPLAMNKNGTYVSQVSQDCDFVLDLHFFQIRDNYIPEIQAYKNLKCNSEAIQVAPKEGHPENIFWHKNNQLYLCSYDYLNNACIYYRISLN